METIKNQKLKSPFDRLKGLRENLHLKLYYFILKNQVLTRMYYLIFGFTGGDCVRYLHQRKIIVDSLLTRKLDVAIDVGSGFGLYTLELLRVANEVIALDTSRFSTKLLQNLHKVNLHIVLADARHLPFKDESAQFVLCTEVLEHLNEDYKAVEEISRVLKNGCYTIVSIPCEDANEWFKKSVTLDQGSRGHVRFGYKLNGATIMLSKSNLHVEQHFYCTFFFAQLAMASSNYTHHKLPAIVLTTISFLDPIYKKSPFNIILTARKRIMYSYSKIV